MQSDGTDIKPLYFHDRTSCSARELKKRRPPNAHSHRLRNVDSYHAVDRSFAYTAAERTGRRLTLIYSTSSSPYSPLLAVRVPDVRGRASGASRHPAGLPPADHGHHGSCPENRALNQRYDSVRGPPLVHPWLHQRSRARATAFRREICPTVVVPAPSCTLHRLAHPAPADLAGRDP